ncbi:uncharacterized protein LOC135483426 isoform X2 [Lineus longissimus]
MGKGKGRGERRRGGRRRRRAHRRVVHRHHVHRRHRRHHGGSVFVSGGQPVKCDPCAFIITLVSLFAMGVGGLMIGLGAPANIPLLIPGVIGLIGGFIAFLVLCKHRKGQSCFVQSQGSNAASNPQGNEAAGSVQAITVVSVGGQEQETIMLNGEDSTGATANNWAPPAYPGVPASPYPNYGASSYSAGVNGSSNGINQLPSYGMFTPVVGPTCPPPGHLYPQGSTQSQQPPYPSTDGQTFPPTAPPPAGLNGETAPPSYEDVMRSTGGYTSVESRQTNQAPVPDTVLDVD